MVPHIYLESSTFGEDIGVAVDLGFNLRGCAMSRTRKYKWNWEFGGLGVWELGGVLRPRT